MDRGNAFQKVRIEVPRNAVERYLVPWEEERLLKECPDWLRDVVIFAINTGMRRNEILTMKWPPVAGVPDENCYNLTTALPDGYL